MIIAILPLTSPLRLRAEPLTRAAFAPFGDALANPRPDVLPPGPTSPSPPSGPSSSPSPGDEEVYRQLPLGGALANQGTAIQYRGLASAEHAPRDLYSSASAAAAAAGSGGGSGSAAGGAGSKRSRSRPPATPRLTMFACMARGRDALDANEDNTDDARGGGGGGGGGGGDGGSGIQIRVLERHPFTTQTFVPLASSGQSGDDDDDDDTERYLVVVAPSLPPSTSTTSNSNGNGRGGAGGAGGGLPDVQRARAFVASGAQAVTYGAGTWHAPMVALGPRLGRRKEAKANKKTVDFVVFQFANDVPADDCEEVALEGAALTVVRGRGRTFPPASSSSSSSKL
ncbi:ureidoglycolate hydrolase [Xylariaceae sp. FL0804]|nr:ureidoglycolate hydrolase [Xylariaceae sp. FL0804]